jgi:hypothetical protein
VQVAHPVQVLPEQILSNSRQDGRTVLRALPLPYGDLAPLEVDVLHPELEALVEPETRAIQEQTDEPRLALERVQHPPHLFPAQDDRHPLGFSRAYQAKEFLVRPPQRRPVEKQDRAKRLSLGSRRDILFRREPGEERADLLRPELRGAGLDRFLAVCPALSSSSCRLRRSAPVPHPTVAVHSISTRALNTRPLAPKALRAGRFFVKNVV